MRHLRHSLFYVLLLMLPLFSSQVYGQGHPFYVYGEIWDMDSSVPLPGATVKAIDLADTTQVIQALIDDKGRYELALPFDRSFRVEYGAPGYIGRHVVLELHGVEERRRKGDHGIDIQAPLIRPMDAVDYSIFNERPYAICRVDHKGKTFRWDEAYTLGNVKDFMSVVDKHQEARKKAGL